VWNQLTPLTGNIHLLAPKPLGAKAQGVIAELFNLALSIDGAEPGQAATAERARLAVQRLEDAARQDLDVVHAE